MRKWIALSALLMCFGTVSAGGGNETQGARSSAMGGASVTFTDVWSASNNPGALGLLDKYAVGLAYETRFFLPEAGLKSLVAAAPLGGGTVGLTGHSFGYASYAENRVGLAYARPLAEYISLGIQINYVQTRIGDVYGSRATVVPEIGMLVTPGDRIRIGAHLFNPTRNRLADFDDERLPTSLRVGGQYLFSEKVNAVLEVDKDMDLPVNIKTGLEYLPVEQLSIRAGFATSQGSFAFGVGYLWKGLRADLSANWNQNLGYSSTIALSYAFGKRKS